MKMLIIRFLLLFGLRLTRIRYPKSLRKKADDNLFKKNIRFMPKKMCYVYLLMEIDQLTILQNSLCKLNNLRSTKEVHIFTNVDNLEFKEFSFEYLSMTVHYLDDEFSGEVVFGNKNFNIITSFKFQIIIYLLDKGYDLVVYFDNDVVVLRDTDAIFKELIKKYSVLLQTETTGIENIENYCTGIIVASINSYDFLLWISKVFEQNNKIMNDQSFLNEAVLDNPILKNNIYALSESLFPNGNLWKLIINPNNIEHNALPLGVNPYIFHANYINGNSKKVEVLKTIGLWTI
jgi:hypothetical protein